MTFEQYLILELIGMIKWLVVGGLLIVFAAYLFNRTVHKKSIDSVRLINLATKMLSESAKEGVDYLITELEKHPGSTQ